MGTLTAQARAQAFEEQMLGWLEEARPGFPVLTLPAAPPPKAGACISCGDSIPTGWRCDLCREAVERVLSEFGR